MQRAASKQRTCKITPVRSNTNPSIEDTPFRYLESEMDVKRVLSSRLTRPCFKYNDPISRADGAYLARIFLDLARFQRASNADSIFLASVSNTV